MSEEMLRVWQLRDAVDTAPQSVNEFQAQDPFAAPADDWSPRSRAVRSLDDGAPFSSTGVSTSTGRSLTPNIDRLLQRSRQPLVTGDYSGVTSTATPLVQSYSKGGGPTVSGKQDNDNGGGNGGGNGNNGNNGNHGNDGRRGGNGNPSTPTPEPATMLLFGGAAAAIAGVRKRRRSR
jgi:hypothetical protein